MQETTVETKLELKVIKINKKKYKLMLTYHFYYKYKENIGNLSIFKFQMLPKTLYPSPIAYGLGR